MAFSRKKFFLILLVFFLLTAVGAGAYFGYQYYQDIDEDVDVEEENVDITDESDEDAEVVDEEGSSEEAQNIESAISVVENYMEARMDRNLVAAQPYMTDSLYADFDQGSFAGTSSPSVGGYRAEAEYVELGDLYLVTTEVDWYLQGELTDTTVWTFQVVVEGGEYLVAQVDMSEE